MNDIDAYNTFDISITNNKLFVNGNIGKKKLIFMIDSGAESNVIDSRLPDFLFDKFSIIRNVNLSGTCSTKVQAVYGDMEEVDIGMLKLKSLPFIVTNLGQLFIAIDKCIDGILGFEFLSLNKVGFNFVTNKMYIWKELQNIFN